MNSGFGRALAGVLALGTVVCVVVAGLTSGDPYDMTSVRMVAGALGQGPLDVYTYFEARGDVRWPYPPGYFPVVYGSDRVADSTGIGLDLVFRAPLILANVALAWVVQDFLGRRGHSDRERLAAAALVALGPSFVVISGYHGQIDAVAILPAVIALSVWERSDAPRRAVVAGLLIGLGGALKTVPLLMVIALLPSARTRKEAVTLAGAAAVPVLLAFLPFALTGGLPDPSVLTYRGVPGAGGLSLVAQPEYAAAGLGVGTTAGQSALLELLVDRGGVLVLAAVAATLAIGLRSRLSAPTMAVLLWLAVYAFGVNFFFQYALWGLPFFLMAGYLRETLAVQAALLPAMLIFYFRPWESQWIAATYIVVMGLLWVAAVGGFATLAARVLRRRLAPAERQARAGA